MSQCSNEEVRRITPIHQRRTLQLELTQHLNPGVSAAAQLKEASRNIMERKTLALLFCFVAGALVPIFSSCPSEVSEESSSSLSGRAAPLAFSLSSFRCASSRVLTPSSFSISLISRSASASSCSASATSPSHSASSSAVRSVSLAADEWH